MSRKIFSLPIIFWFLVTGGCFDSSPLDRMPIGIAQTPVEVDPEVGDRVLKTVAFKPPNPDRENPFSMASALETPATAGNILGESGIKVLVYGFAKAPADPSKGDATSASELRAIVSLDGHRATLGVNQEQRGIKVVKIDPPLVTLQSGNFVWTASMFDGPTAEKK
jgi:hypothetical protein